MLRIVTWHGEGRSLFHVVRGDEVVVSFERRKEAEDYIEADARKQGAKPDKCDICQTSGHTQIIDGAMRVGVWAWMCIECHRRFGVGLGLGRGQRFDVASGQKLEG